MYAYRAVSSSGGPSVLELSAAGIDTGPVEQTHPTPTPPPAGDLLHGYPVSMRLEPRLGAFAFDEQCEVSLHNLHNLHNLLDRLGSRGPDLTRGPQRAPLLATVRPGARSEARYPHPCGRLVGFWP